jgi:hypothetical protein
MAIPAPAVHRAAHDVHQKGIVRMCENMHTPRTRRLHHGSDWLSCGTHLGSASAAAALSQNAVPAMETADTREAAGEDTEERKVWDEGWAGVGREQLQRCPQAHGRIFDGLVDAGCCAVGQLPQVLLLQRRRRNSARWGEDGSWSKG